MVLQVPIDLALEVQFFHQLLSTSISMIPIDDLSVTILFSWLTATSATGKALAAEASYPVVPGPASFQLLLFSAAVLLRLSPSKCRSQAIIFIKGFHRDLELTERIWTIDSL